VTQLLIFLFQIAIIGTMSFFRNIIIKNKFSKFSRNYLVPMLKPFTLSHFSKLVVWW